MQKEKLKGKSKGITLVALVLTIIVMLILVGVTISVSLKGGLFSTSKEASSQMQIAAEKEELLEAVIIALGRNGKVNFDNLDNNLPDNFTKIADKTYESSSGNKYQVTEDGEIILLDGNEEEPETPVTPTITLSTTQISKEITAGTPETVELTATLNNASGDLTWESSDGDVAEISGSGTTRTITLKKAGTATITVSYGTEASATCSITVTEKEENQGYVIGNEVTVGGEKFYVIAVSDETVTLLAKYNLNQAGTAQANVEYTETACAFSSSNYWSSETEYPLDLNTYEIPTGVTSVMTKAQKYGESKGGTGRLLTYEEAELLSEDYIDIICGVNIGALDNMLFYWLGTAENSDILKVIDAAGYPDPSWFLYTEEFDRDSLFGVRPVIEILKAE